MNRFIQVLLGLRSWKNSKGVSGVSYCYTNAREKYEVTTPLGAASCTVFKRGASSLEPSDVIVWQWLADTVTKESAELSIQKNGSDVFYAELDDNDKVLRVVTAAQYAATLEPEPADVPQVATTEAPFAS